MSFSITFTSSPIVVPEPPEDPGMGAWLEFRGMVRGLESGRSIGGLRYEIYHAMAERQLRRIHEEIAAQHPVRGVLFIHREGLVRVGETAVYVGVASAHRGEGIRYLETLMNRLKQDVPIWKAEVLADCGSRAADASGSNGVSARQSACSNPQPAMQVSDAVRIIREKTPLTESVDTPLSRCAGRTLRETVIAPHDLPRTARATMDGFAVRADEDRHDWRVARTAQTDDAGVTDLAPDEAVRVSTGTALLCRHPVRVLPVECVRRDGDTLSCGKIPELRHVHSRGADAREGETLIEPGPPLSPGGVALLASLGKASARTTRPLSILHYTTGDEILAPGETAKAGFIFDSNGPLIAALLGSLGETVRQAHLRENYDAALATVRADIAKHTPDLLLVSGGAGPGAGDFTEKLLRDLGYDIAIRGGVNVRPGKPLIFGSCNGGVAFGLPGNPLSHWAAFHTFVIPAIARLRGESELVREIRATLAGAPDDLADARPTNHPALLFWENGEPRVQLYPWSASGNVRALAGANAMVRIAPDSPAPRPGDTVTALVFPTFCNPL